MTEHGLGIPAFFANWRREEMGHSVLSDADFGGSSSSRIPYWRRPGNWGESVTGVSHIASTSSTT